MEDVVIVASVPITVNTKVKDKEMNLVITISTETGIALKQCEEIISYEFLNREIGGWIEAIDLDGEATMWADTEGNPKGLPVNEVATAIFSRFRGWDDVIVGDVVITAVTDDNGDTPGFTQFGAHDFLQSILNGLVADKVGDLPNE